MSQRQKKPINIITYNIRYYHTSISDISRHFLSSSKFNFSSKFNVIICKFFLISIFKLSRNSNSARYSLQIGSNWNPISISYIARNSISARNSMPLFVALFPISIFELARNSNSARYSLQIGSCQIQICISYLARNSISIFVTFFQFRSSSWLEIQTQLDIRFKQGHIGTQYLFLIQLEIQCHYLQLFFQFRSLSWLEIQTQLDIRFRQGQI